MLSRETLTLADPNMWGASGQRDSLNPSISADGQLVVFASHADNLVPNDNFAQINADNSLDAFVYNRATDSVSLVSIDPDGMSVGICGDYGLSPIISPDGRYVLFQPGGSSFLNDPGHCNIYLRDLATGTASLLSVAADGVTGANSWVYQARFSADSRHVAFVSSATNLVPGIHFSEHTNLFVRDLTTGTTSLATVALNGEDDANNETGPFDISADGRFVVFQSSASNLVSIDNNNIEQVYLRDLASGTTTLVSVDPNGLASGMGHNMLTQGAQVISADGRYVVFHSNAANLVPGGGKGAFLRDMRTGVTTLLSASAVDGHSFSTNGSEIISPDGRFAAFATSSNNVTALPTDDTTNVYVRNVQTGALILASVNQAGTAGGNDGSGLGTFYDFAGGLSFSPSGQYLTFRSLATDLTPGVTGAHRNLYARDLVNNTTRLLTPNLAGSDGGNGDADPAVTSFDGQFVAFSSTSDDLVAGDSNHQKDLFLRDVKAGTTSLVSLRSPLVPTAFTADEGGRLSDVTPDGRYVVFTSYTYPPYEDLLPNQPFDDWGDPHLFLRDRQTGTLSVVDLAPNGHAVAGWNGQITDDGRYVAFLSNAAELLPSGVAANGHNVYLRDRSTNTTTLVSVDPAGDRAVNAGSNAEIALSADGRYVAYTAWDCSAVDGLSNPHDFSAVYLRDRGDGVTPASTVLVSRNLAGNGQINGESNQISISADGRYVTFVSTAADLAAGDTNNAPDVFRFDRATGQVSLVSVNAAGTAPGNDHSGAYSPPVMSADGRSIAFTSRATDLVPGTSEWNVFVRDMGDGGTGPSTMLISVNPAGEPANDISARITMTPDGSAVAFISRASDLTADVKNNTGNDVYVGYLRGPLAGTTRLVSVNAYGSGTGSRESGGLGGWVWGIDCPVISDDGRYVAFASLAQDLVPGFVDGNTINNADVYVRDLIDGTTKLITTNLSGTTGSTVDQSDNKLFLGLDGTVVFHSPASDLVADDRNYTADVFAQNVAGRGTVSGQVFNDRNASTAQDLANGPGYALAFDGTNDFIEVANSPDLDLTAAATVSAWVQFDQTPSQAGRDTCLVSQSTGANYQSLDLLAT